MRRGISHGVCARLVVLLASACCILPPAFAWAQNAAEEQSPSSAEEAIATEATTETEAPPADGEEAPPTETEVVGTTAQEVIIDVSGTPAETPGNVAEATAEQEETAPNVADGEVIFTPTPVEGTPGTEVILQDVPPVTPPNAAESRPAATGADNLAEGAAADAEDEIAIPPDPEYRLPSPAELAGPVEGYSEPTMTVQVPPLEFAPERPAADSFYTPGRHYLERRPLPPLDEGESDEERTARNIEESLALLDLAMEQRPEEGMRIPLPSGLMTFKASDSFQYDRRNKILTFTGNAELVFSDIAIWADVIEVNDSAATAYAHGYVAVQQREDIVYCDEAYLNYDTETLELFWIEGNTTGEHLYEPLYFQADRAYGTFDYMILEKALITTCPPLCGAHPDYEIKADKVHYKRDKSFVMHDAYLFLRDTKVAWVPILAVPLPKRPRQPESQESEIQQNYGYSFAEGYFAKFAYTYSTRWVEGVSRPLLGVVKLETMTKRGAGAGIKQSYFIPSFGVGTIEAFYKDDWPEKMIDDVIGRNDGTTGEEFKVTFGQNLFLSPELNGELYLDRTKEIVPRETGVGRVTDTWNGRFNMAFHRNATDASLTLSQSINDSHNIGETLPRTSTRTADLSFTRKLTKEFSLSISPDYHEAQRAQTAANPVDKWGNLDITARFTGARDTALEGYVSTLTYRKTNIDFDGDSYIEGDTPIHDQIPSLQITLPNDLFNDGAYFNSFSVTAERVIDGRRSDADLSPYKKYSINVGGNDNIDFSRGANLTTRVNFKQYFYDDGNALYNLAPSATFNYRSFNWWDFNASWRMSYWQGARSRRATNDRRAYTNNISYGFDYRDNRYLNGKLSGSYDLADWKFGPISSSFNWDPHQLFGLSHTTNYRPSRDGIGQSGWEWGPSSMRATWRSRHISEDGYRNWVFSASCQFYTDYWKLFKMSTYRSTYYKRLGEGWIGGVVADYRINDGVQPAFSKKFARDIIQAIFMRKTNCCTTWEAAWDRGTLDEADTIWVTLYLNALPEYPGRLQAWDPFSIHRPRDNTGMSTGNWFPLEFDAEFQIPGETIRYDVLTEVLGDDGASKADMLFR